MKKLIFILLASLTFLLSCDPHNTENSLTLCLDNETVNKLLSISAARSADPYEGNNYCIYAILRGSAGTTYEKTLYLNEDAAHQQLSEKGITFGLSGVSFRENYDLLLYVVLNGESQYYVSRPNLELNKYGPTYVDINLNYTNYTQWMADVPNINIDELNSNPTGGYNLNRIDPWSYEKTTLYSFDKNARIKIEVSMINYGNEYSYKTYVLHNGKETVLSLTEYDEYDHFLYYDYTITSPGDYTIACRVTDNSSGAFHTEYSYLEFVSNAINTNYVIYDNYYGAINVWETESLNESGILSTSTNYDNTSANNFDFCLTSDSDIFVTDGNTVFRNWDKNNNTISAGGRTLNSLSFDMKRNFIISYGLNGYTKQVGIANVYSPVYSGFSWKDDPKKNTNLELQYAAAYDGIAYLFYTERNAINSPISYTIYVYAYQLNEKSGQYTPPEDDNPIKAYKVCYFNYNDPGNFYPSFKINDAVVVNGNLYFLISCYADGLCYNLLYDFGFTGKINLSTNQISITGHNCTSKPVNDYNFDNTTCFDFTDYLDYYGKNTNTLKACINPQKIVAIKPKSLIISDDGKLYWSDILDANDPLAEGYERNIYRYKNLNRVVTVELDSFGITDVKMLNNISWKNEPTTNHIDWGCGTFIYTPN